MTLRLLHGLVLLMYFGSAAAQIDTISDLAIQTEILPLGVLPPGIGVTIEISVTNFGPDTGDAIFRTLPTPAGGSFMFPPISFPTSISGPCIQEQTIEPLPGELFGLWLILNLPPGETAVCTFTSEILPTSVPAQIAQWRALGINDTTDPNLSNNVSNTLLVFRAPPTIPALNWVGVLLLILVLSATAYIILRRRADIRQCHCEVFDSVHRSNSKNRIC